MRAQEYKRRLAKVSDVVDAPSVRVAVMENGEYFTFDYARDPIPAETVERWQADENTTVLFVTWAESNL